jgi:hypothetical protein
VAAETAVPLPLRSPEIVVEIVIAGVVVAVATVPAKPFAETTETEDTVPDPAAGVIHAGRPETTVRTCPADPIGNLAAAGVAFSKSISPAVVKGDRALKEEDVEVWPVPPLATGRAVPERVTARVPVLVMGDPETLKKDGTVNATDVTVPEPLPGLQLRFPAPSLVRT